MYLMEAAQLWSCLFAAEVHFLYHNSRSHSQIMLNNWYIVFTKQTHKVNTDFVPADNALLVHCTTSSNLCISFLYNTFIYVLACCELLCVVAGMHVPGLLS